MNSLLRYPNEEFFTRRTYPQRGGVQNRGKQYEYAITSLVALRATLDDDVLDMWVASNVDSLGAFDDLVLFTNHKLHGKRMTVAQLTHREQENYVLNQQSFTKEKEKFCLNKFISDYNAIKCCLHEFDKNYDNIDEKLARKYKIVLDTFGDMGVKDTDFILYTNNDLDSDTNELQISDDTVMKRICPVDKLSILHTGINGGRIYHIDCKTDDDFYSKFHFYARQSPLDNIENLIYYEIYKRFGEVDNSISKHILSFFESWATGQLIDHYHLTKSEMKVKLFELLISPYIVEPCLTENYYETEVWCKILKEVDFVIVEEETMAINGYIYFALKTIVDERYEGAPHTHLDKWNTPFTDDIVAHIRTNKGIERCLNKMIGVHTRLTCMLFYKTLWKMGIIPLVVNIEHDILRKMLEILQITEDYKLRLIVIGKIFGKMNKLMSYKTFTSLADISKDVVADITHNLSFSLQGRMKMSLKDLDIDEDEDMLQSISSTTVLKMLTEDYVIGKINDETKYYIDRHLSKPVLHIGVLQEANGQLFIISGDPKKLKNSDRLEVIDYDDLEYFEPTHKNVATFNNYEYVDDNILRKFTAIHNLFYDKSRPDTFEWIKTYGSINALLEFAKLSQENTHQGNGVPRTDQKISIINGDPGIGKSAFMTKIANDRNIFDWIFLINLNNTTADLKDTENALDYFYDKIEGDRNTLTRAVFQVFKSRKLITVLLDGFDEISPTYTDIVTEVVKKFESNGYTTWVSSRPVMKKHLESSFNTLSFTLQPFSDKDIAKYVQSDEEGCSSILGNIQKIFADQIECMRNPLLLKIAVTYIKSNLFNERDVDIVDLYDNFIDEMLELYWKKSNWDTRNNIAKSEAEDKNRKFKNMLTIASLTLFFDKNVLSGVAKMKKVQRFLKNIQKGHKSIGVIIDVTENLEPVFGHRTFAEYLTGKWLAENRNIDESKKMLPKLFSPQFAFIKDVFDRILGKGKKLHVAVINLNIDFVRKCSNLNIDEKDLGGRTPLQLAASRGKRHYHSTSDIRFGVKVAEHYTDTDSGTNEEIFKILLEKGASIYGVDTLMKWNVFNYAAGISCLNLIEILYDCGYNTRVSEIMQMNSLAFFCSTNNYIKIAEKMDHFPIIETMENGQNPIHITSINGFVALLQLILKKDEALIDIDAKDRDGNTALHYAAHNGDNNCIKVLLEKGADVNIKNLKGATPISMAALNGEASAIICLKLHNADFNTLDEEQRSSLHYAAEGGNVDCVHLLVENGCEVNAKDSNDCSPLQLAADHGHEDVIDYLLTKGADVNHRNQSDETVLYLAAKSGHNQCVNLLLKFEADYTLKCKGLTALDVAASKGHIECVKTLAQYATGNNFNLAFHLALKKCHVECVNSLLDIGIDVNARSNYGTPLTHSISSCVENVMVIIKHLIRLNANVNEKSDDGDTPLHKAAATSNLEALKLLIENEADVNATNDHGMTPLHITINSFFEELSLVLFEYNVDINAQNAMGSTPLHLASCSINTLSIADILLNKNAEVNISDANGRIPLHFAAKVGDFDYVNDLISKGSDVNKICNKGVSPLHLATIGNHKRVLQLLIDNDAEVNAPTQNGVSPLHLACYNGALEFAIILLDNGASINALSNQGFTPLDHAIVSGERYLIEHLVTNSARHGSKERALEDSNLTPQFTKHKKEIREDKLNSWTDLHFAAMVNYTTYVPYLLDIIDEVDENGVTALHVAVENGHADFVNALVMNGANLNVSCKKGLTAWDLAKKHKRQCIVEILEKCAKLSIPEMENTMTIET